MAKKKKKKKNPRMGPPKQQANRPQISSDVSGVDRRSRLSGDVRLSQCMIVKNEEKNIRKALGWAKGIAFEQIVVDTGSTDQTAEIAEKLGAKVYLFEWINDFAAAKNFAIEQATGDWIAFLDADEYFSSDCAKKVIPILNEITATPEMNKKCLALGCNMHQLNDEGKTMDVNVQVRLFRNIPRIRYYGRIHEQLSIDKNDIIRTEDISIIHTGYSESSYKETGKAARNIEMLRAELKVRPDDMNIKAYLAESLISSVSKGVGNPANLDEAYEMFFEIANSEAPIEAELKKNAYVYLLNKYEKAVETDAKYEELNEKAFSEFPDDHRIMCYYAAILTKRGYYREALNVLQNCEAKQSSIGSGSAMALPDMILMYTQMVYALQGLGDIEGMMKYTSVMLMMDKTNSDVLANYIKQLMKILQSYDAVLEILGMVYDLRNKEDRAIIANTARECGAAGLAEKLKI